MEGSLALVGKGKQDVAKRTTVDQFVTLRVDGQLFGIPTEQVQDIHKIQAITPVPLAPPEVAGVMNIRGKIVTAIDLRQRLRLKPRDDGRAPLSINVEWNHDIYSLIIDQIGDVLSLEGALFEPNPTTLDPAWRSISEGVYRLEKELMVVTSVNRLLEFMRKD